MLQQRLRLRSLSPLRVPSPCPRHLLACPSGPAVAGLSVGVAPRRHAPFLSLLPRLSTASMDSARLSAWPPKLPKPPDPTHLLHRVSLLPTRTAPSHCAPRCCSSSGTPDEHRVAVRTLCPGPAPQTSPSNPVPSPLRAQPGRGRPRAQISRSATISSSSPAPWGVPKPWGDDAPKNQSPTTAPSPRWSC